MAELTIMEKAKLNKILETHSGYVLDFSNRTFSDFFAEQLGVDIYDDKYTGGSGSKGSRLRAFLEIESNYTCAKLIAALLEYWRTSKIMRMSEITAPEQALYDECVKIPERLKSGKTLNSPSAFQPNADVKDFWVLSESIRESIAKNQPEGALDRLHTFVVKYSKTLCDKYSIQYDKNVPLHSLFGSYVRYLRENGLIESKMTLEILSSSIKVLQEFNSVRNDQSLAHDNPMLNYHESMLILGNMSNAIEFIESLEKRINEKKTKNIEPEVSVDDLPF